LRLLLRGSCFVGFTYLFVSGGASVPVCDFLTVVISTPFTQQFLTRYLDNGSYIGLKRNELVSMISLLFFSTTRQAEEYISQIHVTILVFIAAVSGRHHEYQHDKLQIGF
jgi:hypothetical protein